MQDGAAAVETKVEEKKGTPGNIVSAGAVQKATLDVTQFKDMAVEEEAVVEEKKEGEVKDDTDKTKTSTDKTDVKPAPADLTEEQLKAYFEKQGIAYDGLENLKTKLTPAKEKTAEEIKADAAVKEQRLLAAHLARGGTTANFVELQKIVAGDAKQLGLAKEQEKLLKEGFTQEQATEMVRLMHLQYTPEEIAELEPEQIAAIEKKAAYGLKKQEDRGKRLQNTAKSYLDSLEEEISEQDADKAKAIQHASKVEAALKAFQRKQTLQLGEYDGHKLDPVEFDVSDEIIQKVSEILKDSATLKKSLINDDGSFNLDFLIPNIVASVSRETAVKTAYLTGGTKQVEVLKATFGEKIPDLTKTRKTNGVSGKIVSAGQPTVMARPQQ